MDELNKIDDGFGAKDYEYVEHPLHYNIYDVEVFDMIKRIWGEKEFQIWAKINAFRYRMRMGTKPDNPIEQDLKKEKVYLTEYRKSKEIENNKLH